MMDAAAGTGEGETNAAAGVGRGMSAPAGACERLLSDVRSC
jgi:hypothetical protein